MHIETQAEQDERENASRQNERNFLNWERCERTAQEWEETQNQMAIARMRELRAMFRQQNQNQNH